MTKAIKISIGTTINVSKISPGFMLQIYFACFDVGSIRGLTSTFVAICSSTSYPFVFPSRIKPLSIDTLKLLVTTLRNQDKKVAFIRVDEYGAKVSPQRNSNIVVPTLCAL